MFDTPYDPLHIFKPNGPVNHTAITALLEDTIRATRPAPRADGTAISDADHRTTIMLAIAGLEPGTTAEAMHASQIVAAHATGMHLLDTAEAPDATPLEKRRVASLALGFLRFAQTATRALEKRQALRRKDDLDYPSYVAAIRRAMEGEVERFKQEWERSHQPAATPADAPRPGLAGAEMPDGGQHPMQREAARAVKPEAAAAPPTPPPAPPTQRRPEGWQHPMRQLATPAAARDAEAEAAFPPPAQPAQRRPDGRQNPMQREAARGALAGTGPVPGAAPRAPSRPGAGGIALAVAAA